MIGVVGWYVVVVVQWWCGGVVGWSLVLGVGVEWSVVDWCGVGLCWESLDWCGIGVLWYYYYYVGVVVLGNVLGGGVLLGMWYLGMGDVEIVVFLVGNWSVGIYYWDCFMLWVGIVCEYGIVGKCGEYENFFYVRFFWINLVSYVFSLLFCWWGFGFCSLGFGWVCCYEYRVFVWYLGNLLLSFVWFVC